MATGADYGALILPPPKRVTRPPPPPGAPLRGGLAPAPRPAPRPAPNPAFSRSLPQHPFHQALHEAAQRVRATAPPPSRAPTERQQLQAMARAHPHVGPLALLNALAGQQLRPASVRFAHEGQQELLKAARQRAEGASPLNLGFVNLTPVVSALANVKVPGLGGVPGKLLNEAIDLPAQTFLSGAIAGSATRKAVEGQPGDLSALGKSVLGQIEHPVRSFEQAPLNTGLLLAGGENVLGRLGGRLARTGALGDRAAELASTVRPDLKLYGEAATQGPRTAAGQPPAPKPGEVIVGRKYNPDPLRKAAQRGYEKALPNLPGQLAQADPFQATGWRLRRNLVGGITKVGRVDRIAAASEDTRRAMVKGTVAKLEATRPAVGDHVLTPLIVQRVVHSPETAIHDLQKVRRLWASAQASGDLKGSALKANKANLAHLDAILASPAVQADPVGALAPAFAAAERHVELGHPFTAEQVHGGKLREDQLRAALFPYAQVDMGAVYHDGAMRGPNGEHLSNEAILQHMKESGVEPPGFISHKTGIGGRGSFFKSTLRQPSLERFARTGASLLNGTADHSWEATVGSLAKQATEAAQLQVRRRVVNRLGVGPLYENRQDALAAADNFHSTPEGQQVVNSIGKLVPVHVGSGQIMEQGNIAPAASTQDLLRQFGLAEHTPVDAHELGKFTLMPEQVAKRLQAHDNALSTDSEVARALQVYQQAFRRAKLNTSLPHIFGVAQEQAIRLAAEQAAPRARQAGARFNRTLAQLAELDKHGRLADTHGPLADGYRELAAQFANRGGLAGSQRANDVVRKGDQFAQTSLAGYVVHGAEGAVKSRAGSAMGIPWRAWKAAVEGSLSHVEHGTRNALLGKALRESGIISSYRDLIGQTDQAVKALIDGKLTPNMADHLAQSIDDMGGNWNRQTPAVRKAISKYAPFGLWWLNSMRWLYRLPVTHPIKTAIAAGLYQATREARNAKGQGYDAAHPVPNFLQGAIDTSLPLLGAGKIAPSYYSPGGTLGPEATNTAVEQFLPQFSSLYATARAQNPLSGARLETAQKQELKAPEDIVNLLGETIAGPLPFATQAQKLLTGGGKPYGTSNLITDALAKIGGPPQVKPGTERPFSQVLGKLISPTRFNFPATGSTPRGGLGPVLHPGAGLSSRQRLLQSHHATTRGGLTARQRLAARSR